MKALAVLAVVLAAGATAGEVGADAAPRDAFAATAARGDASAAQPPPLSITAGDDERGWVDLTVAGPAGAQVRLSEDGAQFATLTAGGKRERALAWRCDKRRRTIVAETSAPDGMPLRAETVVATPSCADRFTLALSPRTAFKAGRTVRVRLRDRWRAAPEVPARVCLGTTCRSVAAPGLVRLKAARAGATQVTLAGTGFRVRTRLEVRGAKLRVLATGDSMIQIVDGFLKDGLGGRATVKSDARISTGISKTLMLDWVAQARRQAARRPQATVMFIGANDGFAIGGTACCDAAWEKAYGARVKRMMSAYRRAGLGRVYWLTLPTPRDSARARIYATVNRAIKAAAATFPADEVEVVDLVPVFTPGNRFRSSIGGRTVRQGDGVHLNVAGARIAARVVIRRMRADGLL